MKIDLTKIIAFDFSKTVTAIIIAIMIGDEKQN